VEGQAAIPFSEGNEVFYNKVQVFNRDMTIHVIKYFAEVRLREKREKSVKRREGAGGEDEEEALGKIDWSQEVAKTSGKKNGIRILDALAATALRSVRYAKEIPGVRQIVANDIDPAAVAAAKRNIEVCRCPLLPPPLAAPVCLKP
jgi:tRNA (guanine26-N2/guanine27-N2)-dimethyltransferase